MSVDACVSPCVDPVVVYSANWGVGVGKRQSRVLALSFSSVAACGTAAKNPTCPPEHNVKTNNHATVDAPNMKHGW